MMFATTEAIPPVRRPRLWPWALALAIVVISLAAELGGLILRVGYSVRDEALQSSTARVDAFLDHLAAGRVDAAYAMTSARFRGMTSREAFREIVSGLPWLKEAGRRSYDRNWHNSRMSNLRIRYRVGRTPRFVEISLARWTESMPWEIDSWAFP